MNDRIFSVRLKPHELAWLQKVASARNRRPSTYVRDLITRAQLPKQGKANGKQQKQQEFAQTGAH